MSTPLNHRPFAPLSMFSPTKAALSPSDEDPVEKIIFPTLPTATPTMLPPYDPTDFQQWCNEFVILLPANLSNILHGIEKRVDDPPFDSTTSQFVEEFKGNSLHNWRESMDRHTYLFRAIYYAVKNSQASTTKPLLQEIIKIPTHEPLIAWNILIKHRSSQ
jgi:hypothetical protein